MIEVESVRFAWHGAKDDCLDIERFEVTQGQHLFLHGPSGCGKSTLLGLLAGVLVPREGRVQVLGQNWAKLSSAQRDAVRADQVGYIFQQFNLLPYLSVLDNVLLPSRFSDVRRRSATNRSGAIATDAGSLLSRFGLPESLWHRPASTLSVGQQQRVAAARALLGTPRILIADEPTSALDAPLRNDFMKLLLSECKQSGSTLVFVSHDERLADQFDRQISLPQINRATRTLDLAV